MQGELDQDKIDQLLYYKDLGRIACYAEGRPYIVPINYVYDGTYIYAHSLDGKKLDMMRTNPEICFEVDMIQNTSNWRSVIAWGTFEELKGEEATRAMKLLTRSLISSIAGSSALHDMNTQVGSGEMMNRPNIVVYRIHLTEKTGRFEIPDDTL